MKRNRIIFLAVSLFALSGIFLPAAVHAQHNDKAKMVEESKKAKASFVKSDRGMNELFKKSYGYVIFPNIGKGALIVGGAGGKGTVFEQGVAIGKAKMSQVTAGLQVGGQSYREVIFFENKAALDHFKGDKLEFSGQVSAAAAKEGASANVKYTDGVAVFTQERGGLMLEASLGGQKLDYQAF